MTRRTSSSRSAAGWPLDPSTWARILARDLTLDGQLVFAVRTTRIYCRPTCPSRRPNPENVTLYRDPEQASADGYRACKRCKPDRDDRDDEVAFIQQVTRYLETHSTRPTSLDRLGAHFGLDPSTLRRRFERATGVTPHAYLEALRLRQIRHALQGGATVRDATYQSGFGSTRRVYTRVRERIGMAPGAYREGGATMHIRHAFADCALGVVLVAATAQGIASVQVGDDKPQLLVALRREYPNAHHEEAPAVMAEMVDEVVCRLAGRPARIALPFDIAATAFRIRVYEALLAIPRGETRTYQEVATAIGAPGAARAVGTACAANRLAGVIPCHRVVRSDGGLGGYRWGTERKRRLLADENGTTEQ